MRGPLNYFPLPATLADAPGPGRTLQRAVVLSLLLGAATPNVDNWAHLGGLAGGALLTFAIGPNLQWEGYWLVDRPLLRLPRHRPRR